VKRKDSILDISVKCSHCGEPTFLERMPEARFERLKPALLSLLHTSSCKHCHKPFGVNGGALVKDVVG
jgi:hypothetical protein